MTYWTYLVDRYVEGRRRTYVREASLEQARGKGGSRATDMAISRVGPEDAVEDKEGDESELGCPGPHDGRWQETTGDKGEVRTCEES